VVARGGRDFGRCPLAAHLPTALWPVAEKPVLAHLLRHLADAGFGRVAVCCARDDATAVEAVCRNAPLEAALVIEELTAGTAGCLRNAVGSDPGDLILALSGSMLAPPTIEDLVAKATGGIDDGLQSGSPRRNIAGQPGGNLPVPAGDSAPHPSGWLL
jgi:NDP-sugar pyrophosphorylase family protein